MAEQKLIIKIKTYDSLFEVIKNIPAVKNYNDNEDKDELELVRLIAKHCNYGGMSPLETINEIQKHYGLEKVFVEPIVLDTYEKNTIENGTKAIMYNLKVRNQFDEDDWLKLPFIPDDVYVNLPPILKKSTSVFSDKRERDVFFTGTLVVLSGLLCGVQGIYLAKTVYPNLYCFIIAPAGSGKGSMIYAKELGMPFHDSMREFDINRLLYIPTNISTASLYQQLETNGGTGILFESEADTMTNSFKQEWGGYSDILRKAFHHESISLKRKDKDKESSSYLEVRTPKISVALSGTRNQIRGIIQNTEDGLFSRFLMYTFKSEPYWNMNDNEEFSYDDFFQNVSKELSEVIENLSMVDKFSLTKEQRHILNSRFSRWQDEFALYYAEESISIVRRMGLMTFKISMILTLIRQGHVGKIETNEVIYCNDLDFNMAFMLIETYIQHSLYLFVTFDKKNQDNVIDRKVQMFYESLPNKVFTRRQAVIIGKENVDLEERTVDKYLKNLLKTGYLIQPDYGKYEKTL